MALVEELAVFRATWRDRIKAGIREKLPPGAEGDAQAEQRFQDLMNMEVPLDQMLADLEKERLGA